MTVSRTPVLVCAGLLQVATTVACSLSQLPTAVSPLLSPFAADSGDDPSILPRDLLPWIPFILGGLIIVTLVALLVVLLLSRRSVARRVPTQKLPPLRGEFQPLSEGAVLNGRYVIRSLVASGSRRHLYEIEDTQASQLCSACYTVLSDREDKYCPKCGVALREAPPVRPRLLAREAAEPQAFAAGSQLVALHLEHENLVLPMSVFAENTVRGLRHYQIEPDVRALRFEAVAPQPSPRQLLEWGIALTQGVEYLHRSAVVALPIASQNVILDGPRVRLACCDGVQILTQETETQAPAGFAEDVRRLASLLAQIAAPLPAPREGQPPVAQALSAWLQQSGAGPTAAGLAAELRRLLRVSVEPAKVAAFLVGSKSVVGQVREINEDSIFVEDYPIALTHLGMPVGVYAVADGVGGQAAGEVASHLVVETLAESADSLRIEVAKGVLPDLRSWLARTATAANDSVHSRRVADRNDMGSTLVMAVVTGATATLLNIGDSRAYRLTQSGVEQVSVDHSLVQRLVDLGHITREEAQSHPQRSVIYRAIGDRPEVSYDLYTVSLNPGDAILLCSDGLTDVVRDESLWNTWRASESPQQACDRLVASANQAGGPDNISVIIVQMA